jgi:RHS repeat-associated protein
VDYDPFGSVIRAVGVPSGSFGYAREQYDAASGLTFLRARYYDPTLGRFLNRDTYPAYAPVPQTLHRYVYVKNNPINHTDPAGLCPWYDLGCNAKKAVDWGKQQVTNLGNTVSRGWDNLKPVSLGCPNANKISTGFRNTVAQIDRGIQDFRRDPLGTIDRTGRAIGGFLERKNAELNNAARQVATAWERGDAGGVVGGVLNFAASATGVSDLMKSETGRFVLGAGLVVAAVPCEAPV